MTYTVFINMDIKITSDQLNRLIAKIIELHYKGYEWKEKTIQGSRLSLLKQSGYGFSFSNSEKNYTVLSFYHFNLGEGPFAITSNQLYITNDFVDVLKRFTRMNEDLIIKHIVNWVENELNVKVDKVNKTPAKLA